MKQTSSSGIGFGGMLAVLFIGLKLTGHIDWSWWWVLCPMWGPIAVALVLLLALLLFAGTCQFIVWLAERK